MATYEDFKQYKQLLADGVCYQLYNILRDCHNRHASFSFNSLLQDVEKVNQKLRSHRFRIAIIGEFSRGKSTLVNALVGEQIQPVRAIACSGTITVLRHGAQKRVICYYKDGRVQEVPLEEYQDLVKISKEAARKYLSDELARSQIEEVVFEHPNLELCRNGVEIIDSPGLNEHPERERITQKLIQHADAVIFLLLASQILIHSERELLQDVRRKLCNGKEDEVANNLFLVINKIDELDSEEDRQDVRDVVEEFTFRANLIPKVRDRIHYVSAKESFNARLTGNENDKTQTFREFIEAVERFSVHERGSLEIYFAASEFFEIIKNVFQFTDTILSKLNGDLHKKELRKQKILEELGEIAGISKKIVDPTKQSVEKCKINVLKKIKKSWNNWLECELYEKLSSESKKWKTNKENAYGNQKYIVKDYIKCFKKDLKEEFLKWSNVEERKSTKKLQSLQQHVFQEVSFVVQATTMHKKILLPDIVDINISLKEDGYNDIWDNLWAFVGIANFFNLIKLDLFKIKNQIAKKIREKVIKEGYTAFKSASDEIYKRMETIVVAAFLDITKTTENFFKQEIENYEQQLQEADRVYQTALKEYETEKAWIEQKRQELDRVRQELETVLSQLHR